MLRRTFATSRQWLNDRFPTFRIGCRAGALRVQASPMAAIARGREPDGFLDRLPLSWDDTGKRFSLDIRIGGPLKWMCQQASFASVFSGSNDRRNATSNVELITDHLAGVASIGKVSLVSVIGGTFLLDLVQRVAFSRVILFDQNVAEFAKMTALLNLMAMHPEDDPFDALEHMVLTQPDALLPRLPLSEVSCHLAPGSEWEFEGAKEAAFPLLLRKNNYPHYAWNADAGERMVTLARLRAALCRTVFLELPSIDAAGHLIVVFCSNADHTVLSDEFIRSKFLNAAGVIVIRSLIGDNQSALDPHPYWEVVARTAIVGVSHQIWAPEDAAMVGGPLDCTTHTSSVLGRPVPPVDPETLLCHILLGKCRGNLTDRRAAVVRCVQSLPESVNRMVVAEYNPACESGAAIRHEFDSIDRLRSFYAETLHGFGHVDTLYAPGLGDSHCNVFFVFTREPSGSRFLAPGEGQSASKMGVATM
jgi:hypothetical protein